MKIAIVGAGIAGLAAASRLHPAHDITVFEADTHAGGHALTAHVSDPDVRASLGLPESAARRDLVYPADLGFMVWNHHTYPGLHALFDQLGVETAPTSMGFSVRDERSGLEYAGETFDTLFAQRRNLFRPAFWDMIRAIVRFNQRARAWVEGPHANATLGELLAAERLPRSFRDHFLIPMGAAIWSASEHDMEAFPAAFFVRFLANHGMLEPPSKQFTWHVMTGGSERYVAALSRPFADRIRLATPVRAVRRTAAGVEVATDGASETFAQVVLALHADQARAVLQDATPLEAEALAAFPYRTNDAVLHTDVRVLPRRRRAWASWNYHVPTDRSAPVSVTYDLSRLQHLATPSPLLLTLNDSGRIAPARVLRRQRFTHPAFTRASIAMQARHAEVSGSQHVHFCGAYWRNGFHEDGHWSGVRVADRILGREPSPPGTESA